MPGFKSQQLPSTDLANTPLGTLKPGKAQHTTRVSETGAYSLEVLGV